MAMAERASLVNSFLHPIVSRSGRHDYSAVHPNRPIGAMAGDMYVLLWSAVWRCWIPFFWTSVIIM